MKVLLDTNVIVSAIIFGGMPRQIIIKLLDLNHEVYVSEYVDDELKSILAKKWPDKADFAYRLFHQLKIQFVPSTHAIHNALRDLKDNPVLADAQFYNVDVLVTGDKDFLDANIDRPVVLSPKQLLESFEHLQSKYE